MLKIIQILTEWCRNFVKSLATQFFQNLKELCSWSIKNDVPKKTDFVIMIKPNSLNKYCIMLSDSIKQEQVQDCAETIKQIVEPDTGHMLKTFPYYRVILLESTDEIMGEVQKLPFIVNIENTRKSNVAK